MSEATASLVTSTSTPKVSLFAAKSGFVIPKNKLSGSLVPIFQRNKKLIGGDTAKEESPKQSQRKTKWGPDLTQDATVKKGRALALQTRVDQITQQLRSGILELCESLDSPSVSEQLKGKSSGHVLDREKSKQLELERREAIGEILKLNANYKAPPDYKPLLKEDRVPIPVKEFPGYNFIGLIFGPGGDNRKRLEKETGAKLQVYGIKAGKDKAEIIPVDGNDFQGSYEEIYIHVSADMYDKVDAAVSVIELLVTSVSGNLATASALSTATGADNQNILSEQHASIPVGLAPQGAGEPFMGSSRAPSEGHFQFSSPWASMPSPSIFNPPNSSALANNLLHQPSPPSSRPNLTLPFGSQPALAGTNLLPPNQSSQFMQNPYMNHPHPPDIRLPPGNHVLPVLQSSTAPFPSVARPSMAQGPHPMFPQPNIASTGPISNTSMANTNPSSLSFASGSPTLISPGGPLNRPIPPNFPSAASSTSLPIPINNSPQGMPTHRGNPLNSSLGLSPSQLPSRPPLPPFESSPGPNFPPMRSSSVAAPQNPNFGDFTFQHHHRPQMPRYLPPNAAPQAPSFRSSPVPDFQPRPEFPRPPIPGRFPFPNRVPAMGEMNYGPAVRSPNLGPAFPSGPGNLMETRGIFRSPMNRADMLLPPIQQFNRNLPFGRPGPGAREPQVYDPFSPTTMSNIPQRQGDNLSGGKRRENDPEYEDLMASVGVK
ncbi:hypothetical protein CDL15_Pgr028751 [Punica granatum]|nr:hypothetical protein CDL15_Pgr028751 [Punica granatum]